MERILHAEERNKIHTLKIEKLGGLHSRHGSESLPVHKWAKETSEEQKQQPKVDRFAIGLLLLTSGLAGKANSCAVNEPGGIEKEENDRRNKEKEDPHWSNTRDGTGHWGTFKHQSKNNR